MTHTIINSDCLEYLRSLQDNTFDSIVTDPPYGLSFMGMKWDCDVPSVDIWRECLRVLKPGGHLLSFAGTRTQHRMAVNIEDAGFEIRDMIAWVYGSCIPKSLDVSKAIDKRGGNVARFAEFRDAVKDAMKRNGVSRQKLQDALGNYMISHYLTAGSQPAIPILKDYRIIRDVVGLGNAFDELFNDEAERPVIGRGTSDALAFYAKRPPVDGYDITAPATDAARQWQGWGTALKPALEPITVARKPLVGTVAENVLEWGTGAINVDGCRVGPPIEHRPGGLHRGCGNTVGSFTGSTEFERESHGRWPANLIHDGSDEVTGLFGTAARFFYCAKASKKDRNEGLEEYEEVSAGTRTGRKDGSVGINAYAGATGSARNFHPTVKPTTLMRYLCRLITPPGGTILDPFAGSGSTGKAAKMEGFNFVGIEREKEYCEIAKKRIESAARYLD